MASCFPRARARAQTERRRPPQVAHENAVPGCDHLAIGTASDTAAGYDSHLTRRYWLEPGGRRRGFYGAGKAMLRVTFESCRTGQRLIRFDPLRLDADDASFARRERARLVKRQRSCPREGFERARLPNQTAALRESSDADRGRQGRGQADRAR